MRALFWTVAIVVAAVALALAARHNPGYAVLVMPPYRIELSLNLLAVVLAAGFALLYAVTRAVSATVRLPRVVRDYRAARRRESARGALIEAAGEYFAGRYARAERAAAKALELGEHPVLAAVIAARAAHELRAYDRRDAHLARAAAAPGGGNAMRLVSEAELLLEERRFQEALDALGQLPRSHTAALRLELKAQQRLRNWDRVLALLAELEKRNVYDAAQAAQLRRYAHAENLKRKALDAHSLEEAWQKVPPRVRTDARVAAAAAQCFIALGGCERAHRIIEEALEAGWDSGLVGLYAECQGGDTVHRIERAEGWLRSHPADAALLLALGRLCAEQGLWGKAQSYLEASIAVEPTHSAHLALAQLHEKLGHSETARRHYREGLELALAQLRAATGGRRRMPI